ncbi:MAG: hypothetical protein IPK60_10590 [Sandaracinaceae bacterium]|nr:hypothetical protein [Sandaracinaceae bacterium]
MFEARKFRLGVLALVLSVSASAVAQNAPSPVPSPAPAPTPAPEPTPPTIEAPPPAQPTGVPPTDASPVDSSAPAAAPVAPTAETPAPVPATDRCIIIDAAVYGVSPIVGEHVSTEMRTTATSLGYRTLTRDETVATAQSSHMPYPPTPADLWRTTWAAHAARGAFARVWASQGRYIIEITVASADGGGPFFARGASGAQDLHAVVHALTLQALPPPGVTVPTGTTNAIGFGAPEPESERPSPVAARPARQRTGRAMRWVLSMQTESAFGTSSDFYYNHLFGLRLDYRITPDIRIGAYLAYANLRGSDGRVGNMLMYVQLEDRVRVTPTSPLRVPLRVAVGYLPYNGPVIRLAAGLAVPLSRRVDLVFDILAPTIWMIPDRTLVSLDVSAEVSVKF